MPSQQVKQRPEAIVQTVPTPSVHKSKVTVTKGHEAKSGHFQQLQPDPGRPGEMSLIFEEKKESDWAPSHGQPSINYDGQHFRTYDKQMQPQVTYSTVQSEYPGPDSGSQLRKGGSRSNSKAK